jgi:hypothetical protein
MLDIRDRMRRGMSIAEICNKGFPLPGLDDPATSAMEESGDLTAEIFLIA